MMFTFNELSLHHKAVSVEMAYANIERFVLACIEARRLGLGDLRLNDSHLPHLYTIPVYPGYNIDQWLNDERIDEVLRSQFREIVTSSPLINEDEVTAMELYSRSEFKKDLDGETHQVWGLGAAYIFDTLALSIATHQEWEKHEIEITHYYLDEDLTERSYDVSVKHFSSPNNLKLHLPWWEDYQENALKKSAELWEKRMEFFPNLEFSDEVEQQLNKMGISKSLTQIIDRLRDLNNYVKGWQAGNGDFNYKDAIEKTSLRISPESSSTIRKFGTLRKFSIPDQGKKLFDLHIKTGDLRFHFYPDNVNRKVYIGYIGKHLRISSEN